jgi:hypothetical protein
MSPGEEFLDLYNKLDQHLRGLLLRFGTDSRDRPSFSQVVKQLALHNATIRNNYEWLIEYGELRNALVHEKSHGGVQLLADPRPETLERFRQFVGEMLQPTKVDGIASKPVREFSSDASLSAALAFMHDKDFSQIVVRLDGKLKLLSQAGLTRWLESKYDHGWLAEDTVAVGDVVRFEPDGTCKFVGRRVSADEVVTQFVRLPGPSSELLRAVIVTESGKPTEKAIGLVTPWDSLKYESRTMH